MNPDTIQFQCGFCHTNLTVPAQMAGVTGPCPSCGQTVTSPAPADVPVTHWTPAAQPPAPAWPPSPPSPMMGELPASGMPASSLNAGLNLNTQLPPKRAPGQSPLSTPLNIPAGQTPWSSPPASPAAMPSSASRDAPAGHSGSGLPNQSRFIPGAPTLPNMTALGAAGGMPGILHNLQGSSLLGRDVPSAPLSPLTQQLHSTGAPSEMTPLLRPTWPPFLRDGTLPAWRRRAGPVSSGSHWPRSSSSDFSASPASS